MASDIPEYVFCGEEELDWTYDGENFTLIVPLPESEWNKPLSGHVVYSQSSTLNLTDGIIGNSHRAAKAIAGLKNRKANIVLNDALGLFGSIGQKVTYFPNTLHESVNSFRQYFDDINTSLGQQEGLDEEIKAWFKGQLGK